MSLRADYALIIFVLLGLVLWMFDGLFGCYWYWQIAECFRLLTG